MRGSTSVIQHDDQLVKDYGVTLAVQMIGRLTAEAKVPGVHFCTLNLEKSVQRVLEQLQWVGKHPEIHNKLISVRTTCCGHVCERSDGGRRIQQTTLSTLHLLSRSM